MASKVTFIDPKTGKQKTIERKSGESARKARARSTGTSEVRETTLEVSPGGFTTKKTVVERDVEGKAESVQVTEFKRRRSSSVKSQTQPEVVMTKVEEPQTVDVVESTIAPTKVTQALDLGSRDVARSATTIAAIQSADTDIIKRQQFFSTSPKERATTRIDVVPTGKDILTAEEFQERLTLRQPTKEERFAASPAGRFTSGIKGAFTLDPEVAQRARGGVDPIETAGFTIGFPVAEVVGEAISFGIGKVASDVVPSLKARTIKTGTAAVEGTQLTKTRAFDIRQPTQLTSELQVSPKSTTVATISGEVESGDVFKGAIVGTDGRQVTTIERTIKGKPFTIKSEIVPRDVGAVETVTVFKPTRKGLKELSRTVQDIPASKLKVKDIVSTTADFKIETPTKAFKGQEVSRTIGLADDQSRFKVRQIERAGAEITELSPGFVKTTDFGTGRVGLSIQPTRFQFGAEAAEQAQDITRITETGRVDIRQPRIRETRVTELRSTFTGEIDFTRESQIPDAPLFRGKKGQLGSSRVQRVSPVTIRDVAIKSTKVSDDVPFQFITPFRQVDDLSISRGANIGLIGGVRFTPAEALRGRSAQRLSPRIETSIKPVADQRQRLDALQDFAQTTRLETTQRLRAPQVVIPSQPSIRTPTNDFRFSPSGVPPTPIPVPELKIPSGSRIQTTGTSRKVKIGVKGRAPSLVTVARGGKELERFRVRRF